MMAMHGEPEAVSADYQKQLAREARMRRALDRQVAWRQEKEKIVASLAHDPKLVAWRLQNRQMHPRDRARTESARTRVYGRGGDRLLVGVARLACPIWDSPRRFSVPAALVRRHRSPPAPPPVELVRVLLGLLAGKLAGLRVLRSRDRDQPAEGFAEPG
jgi:hypothetical protein